LLSPIFEDDALSDIANRYVTCLVRVPEAYTLVREYKTVRPGFLVLKTDGSKWGSISLSAVDPEESGRQAVEYLRRALEAQNPLPDCHEHPESDPSILTGSLQVQSGEAGSLADLAGFKAGDVL
jgi:hypothetical protein